MNPPRTSKSTGATTKTAGTPRTPPRAPGLLYAGLAVAVSVLIATLTLTSRQMTPPTIAEFAPRAVEQITDASQAESGSSGAESGSRLDADIDPVTGRPRDLASVDVARVRQCVGEPPRQIEDPQSPPCVPYWMGDNGGATWRGVTRDEVRVTDAFGNSDAFASFFNRRFELYGRRIRLIPRNVPTELDPVGQRVAARAVHDEDRSFASTGSPNAGHHFYDELARLGVLSAHHWALFPEAYLASHRPYVWIYPMANDRMFAMTGNWYCARFAGRNASHAGDPVLQRTRRKAGIFLMYAEFAGDLISVMNAELEKCGEQTNAVIVEEYDSVNDRFFYENAMLQLKTAGVTTVAFLGNFAALGLYAMSAATHQGYFPEWVVPTYFGTESTSYVRTLSPPEQNRSLMLLSATPMERAPSEHPSSWAMTEVGSTSYPSQSDFGGSDGAYRSLLLIASGIQMAGPQLTPDTFERGLHATRFPNPPHRIMAGAVGFMDGDHSMTDDAAENWWSNTTRSPYPNDPPGAFCYVDGGARRRMGGFPTSGPFFTTGHCDNGT